MASGADAVIGEVDAVDEHVAAGDAVVRGVGEAAERVGELVVTVEGAVGQHQRDVALAARQGERGVELVVDDEHPGEPAPDVRRGALEAMVVIPLKRGALGRRRPRSGRRCSCGSAPARSAGRCPSRSGASRRGDVAVAARAAGGRSGRRAGRPRWSGCGRRAGGRSARRPRPAARAGSDLGQLARRAADRRPREGAAVGPHPGLARRAARRPSPACISSSISRAGEHLRDPQRPPERLRLARRAAAVEQASLGRSRRQSAPARPRRRRRAGRGARSAARLLVSRVRSEIRQLDL